MRKRYFVVQETMPGYLDQSEPEFCYDVKQLRACLKNWRWLYTDNDGKQDYDVINPVSDIIDNAGDCQYIMSKNGSHVVWVERVYVNEPKSVQERTAEFFGSEYSYAQSDFDYLHLASLANVVTAAFYKGDIHEPSEIWVTDDGRPFELNSVYTRVL